ncbi:MAG: bifunctional phosphoribosyl-AMP cyclohydrolase/phosphoribosyl-ATP diphosphatase HisIE [Dehalococcoidia bacterium]|nr:bifunctional phosphoribosyl-AMP cyclohydrolase/phosphoribosyl-ATP diphosphatase HisIE [Dehalococcoidia bacterium]
MIKFDDKGLVPAVVQDERTGEVLMLAYVNDTALHRTMETGQAWFYSRSRQQLWRKGETSGNYLSVKSVHVDCDEDTIVYIAEPAGPTCHTGERSCFFRSIDSSGEIVPAAVPRFLSGTDDVVDEVFRVIKERQTTMPEGSYTAYLFREGVDKIAKKIGEESAEVIIASKNGVPGRIAEEVADLWYHTLVMLAATGLSPEDVRAELEKRRK